MTSEIALPDPLADWAWAPPDGETAGLSMSLLVKIAVPLHESLRPLSGPSTSLSSSLPCEGAPAVKRDLPYGPPGVPDDSTLDGRGCPSMDCSSC